MRLLLYLALTLYYCTCGLAQDLPLEVRRTDDGRLVRGNRPVDGLYDMDSVYRIDLLLAEPNWFTILDGTGRDSEGTPLAGTLIFNETITLDSVLIGIKGETSDRRNRSEKKSFSIKIDEFRDQELLGYDNLNLNGAFEDESGMREVLYYAVSRGFTQALKGNFVDLYINGEYWGPYNNIQQVEGRYQQEWFLNNDGTRWRARPPEGVTNPPAPGGDFASRFGAGTRTLNYNGPDSTDYNREYDLRNSTQENPWQGLIDAADALNNLPIDQLYEELRHELDIDRTLWFLAQEIVFSDDDGYINKGGSDYYVYWDEATERLMPLEVDGNSVMSNNFVEWGIFYREDDERWPLMNRMLQNPEIRQRYLAHMRTILAEHFVVPAVHAQIDEFAALLDQRVQDDPKALYDYQEFLTGVDDVKQFVTDRAAFIAGLPAVAREGRVISELTAVMERPTAGAAIPVTVSVAGGTERVYLYYGAGLDGIYDRTLLLDDGLNGDGAAGDGVYGGELPGQAANTYVRYYVEAVADDGFSTATYLPAAAENDVYFYQVAGLELVNSDVAINELVASNDGGAQDANGDFEDWVELYNNGTETVDLSGYFLSDDEEELDQWMFPAGTTIAPGGYLIVWTDNDEEDTTAEELHANFALSAGGETLVLSNAAGEPIDRVMFGEQTADVAFARVPNGTGDFVLQAPTFGGDNEVMVSSVEVAVGAGFQVYPNPVGERLFVSVGPSFAGAYSLRLFDASGRLVRSGVGRGAVAELAVGGLTSGLYLLRVGGSSIGVRVVVR